MLFGMYTHMESFGFMYVSVGLSEGSVGSHLKMLSMYMALILAVIVPVLFMYKAFRYSVSLIFIVERANSTIFSCTRSSSTLIDSWAFSP